MADPTKVIVQLEGGGGAKTAAEVDKVTDAIKRVNTEAAKPIALAGFGEQVKDILGDDIGDALTAEVEQVLTGLPEQLHEAFVDGIKGGLGQAVMDAMPGDAKAWDRGQREERERLQALIRHGADEERELNRQNAVAESMTNQMRREREREVADLIRRSKHEERELIQQNATAERMAAQMRREREREVADIIRRSKHEEREALAIEKQRTREVEKRVAAEQAAQRAMAANVGRALPGMGGVMGGMAGGGPGAGAAGMGAAVIAMQQMLGFVERYLEEVNAATVAEGGLTSEVHKRIQAMQQQAKVATSPADVEALKKAGEASVEAQREQVRAMKDGMSDYIKGSLGGLATVMGAGNLLGKVLGEAVKNAQTPAERARAGGFNKAAQEEQFNARSVEQARKAADAFKQQQKDFTEVRDAIGGKDGQEAITATAQGIGRLREAMAGMNETTPEGRQQIAAYKAEIEQLEPILFRLAKAEQDAADAQEARMAEWDRENEQTRMGLDALNAGLQQEGEDSRVAAGAKDAEQVNEILTAQEKVAQEQKDEQAILRAKLDDQDELVRTLEIEHATREKIKELGNAGVLTAELQKQIEITGELQKQAALKDLEEKRQRSADAVEDTIQAADPDVDTKLRGSKRDRKIEQSWDKFEKELNAKIRQAQKDDPKFDEKAARERARETFEGKVRDELGRVGGPVRHSDRNNQGPTGPSDAFKNAFGGGEDAAGAPGGSQFDRFGNRIPTAPSAAPSVPAPAPAPAPAAPPDTSTQQAEVAAKQAAQSNTAAANSLESLSKTITGNSSAMMAAIATINSELKKHASQLNGLEAARGQ